MEDKRVMNAVRKMSALKLLRRYLNDENAYKEFERNKRYPKEDSVAYFTAIDYVDDVKYFKVNSHGLTNYINAQDGTLYSDEWFYECYLLSNGVIAVDDGTWKGFFFVKDGKKITDLRFWNYSDFSDGIACVELAGDTKWTYINENGELLCDLKFDSIDMFYDDIPFAVVEKDKKYNFLRKDGKLIGNIWYDGCIGFNEFGVALVVLNGKCNFLKSNGKYLLNDWFDKLKGFDRNGIAHGILKGQKYKIDIINKSIKKE